MPTPYPKPQADKCSKAVVDPVLRVGALLLAETAREAKKKGSYDCLLWLYSEDCRVIARAIGMDLIAILRKVDEMVIPGDDL